MVQPRSYRWCDLPDHARPFGAQLVIDQLRHCGHEVGEIIASDNGGNLLLSLYWCEDLYAWVRYRRRNNIDTRWHVIIGGNHATGSPNTVSIFSDGVFLGDADEWDGIDYSNITRGGEPAKLSMCQIPQRCITMEAKAVAKHSFEIMELSRGCRMRCHYCQYAWMKPYREQSADFIVGQMTKLGRNKRVRLASADIPQHSCYTRICDAARQSGVRIMNQDGALLTVARLSKVGEVLAKMQRFGVDGMSERLRLLVKKPIKREWLIDRIKEYNHRGVTRCLAYNIFGLPGETKDDFLEWDDTVRRIVDGVKPPFTWVNSWNAFLPMPMTPLERHPSSWGNDHRDLCRMSETRRYAKGKGINVFDMPERTGDRLITLRMLAIRGTAASKHIIERVSLDHRITDRQILREYTVVEGRELHAAYGSTEALPWTRYYLAGEHDG